ncbi:MAG TPA: hypothetical protein VGG39_35425 [Polyangiaceae bacterium]|jgi:hypothetical protein
MISPRTIAAAALAVAPLVAAGNVGCGSGADASGVASAKLPKGASGLEHESCDESGNRVEILDLNNDGKPDIRRVFNKGTGREICRISDLNHDGQPDLYEYFDANGAVRRRELCFDDTGVVNAIEHFDGGRLTKREYDTGGMHRIDTWDYFDPGLPMDAKTGRPVHPSRRERDTKGEGHVDQWWTWNGDKISISRDTTGDGKPDPASTLVLDPSGGGSTPGSGGGGTGGGPSGAADAGASSSGTDAAAPVATGSAPSPAASIPASDGGAPSASADGGKR